jgi:Flp pilus assembly protein TadD
MSTVYVLNETNESKVLYAQAMELFSRNHIPEAMKRLEEALQISPDNATYMSQYGLCVALERKDFDSALKLCERAVRMEPENPINGVNLGRVYKLLGENAAAHDLFLKAWEKDKTHPAPATELYRMGVRRPPVIPFLSRSNWLNKRLGMLRDKLQRGLGSLI